MPKRKRKFATLPRYFNEELFRMYVSILILTFLFFGIAFYIDSHGGVWHRYIGIVRLYGKHRFSTILLEISRFWIAVGEGVIFYSVFGTSINSLFPDRKSDAPRSIHPVIRITHAKE